MKVVAAIFIVFGLWSTLDILFNHFRTVSIAPAVFDLPIGIGLLRRRESCRRIAVWSIWATLVCLVVSLGLLFGKAFGAFQGTNVIFKIFGQPMSTGLGAAFAFLFFGVQMVLLPWMWLVLMRDVRAETTSYQNKSKPMARMGHQYSVTTHHGRSDTRACREPAENWGL